MGFKGMSLWQREHRHASARASEPSDIKSPILQVPSLEAQEVALHAGTPKSATPAQGSLNGRLVALPLFGLQNRVMHFNLTPLNINVRSPSCLQTPRSAGYRIYSPTH